MIQQLVTPSRVLAAVAVVAVALRFPKNALLCFWSHSPWCVMVSDEVYREWFHLSEIVENRKSTSKTNFAGRRFL